MWIVRCALIQAVRFYQKCLSPLSVGACRYYPSCSDYTLWLLRFDNPLKASVKSIQRILSCNQFFEGGVAYPQAYLEFKDIAFMPKDVKYWFVPNTNTRFLDIICVLKKTYKMRVYIIKTLSYKERG